MGVQVVLTSRRKFLAFLALAICFTPALVAPDDTVFDGPTTITCPASRPLCNGQRCCVAKNGVCCADNEHCCPSGYTCSTGGQCAAKNNATHKYDAIVPQYRLCQPDLSLHRLKLSKPSGMYFPYFADSPVDAPSRIRMAVIVIHGAARNPDVYFCGMREAAVALQEDWPASDVGVFAPWFMHDVDQPPPGTIQWNGADNDGAWRKGAESMDDGEGTASSFDMLDAMVRSLLDEQLHPLEALAIVGHSSGGQTVQRYALTTKVHDIIKERGIPVRFVVSNPSSYAYLSRKRWSDDSESFADPLPSAINACEGYDRWGWGLGAPHPPYVAGQDLTSFAARCAA